MSLPCEPCAVCEEPGPHQQVNLAQKTVCDTCFRDFYDPANQHLSPTLLEEEHQPHNTTNSLTAFVTYSKQHPPSAPSSSCLNASTEEVRFNNVGEEKREGCTCDQRPAGLPCTFCYKFICAKRRIEEARERLASGIAPAPVVIAKKSTKPRKKKAPEQVVTAAGRLSAFFQTLPARKKQLLPPPPRKTVTRVQGITAPVPAVVSAWGASVVAQHVRPPQRTREEEDPDDATPRATGSWGGGKKGMRGGFCGGGFRARPGK